MEIVLPQLADLVSLPQQESFRDRLFRLLRKRSCLLRVGGGLKGGGGKSSHIREIVLTEDGSAPLTYSWWVRDAIREVLTGGYDVR